MKRTRKGLCSLIQGTSVYQDLQQRVCAGLSEQDRRTLTNIMWNSPAMFSLLDGTPNTRAYNALIQHVTPFHWVSALKLHNELFLRTSLGLHQENKRPDAVLTRERVKFYVAKPDSGTARVVLQIFLQSKNWHSALKHFVKHCFRVITPKEVIHYGISMLHLLRECRQFLRGDELLDYYQTNEIPLTEGLAHLIVHVETWSWSRACRAFARLLEWDKKKIRDNMIEHTLTLCENEKQWKTTLALLRQTYLAGYALKDKILHKIAYISLARNQWRVATQILLFIAPPTRDQNQIRAKEPSVLLVEGDPTASTNLKYYSQPPSYFHSSFDLFKYVCMLSVASHWMRAIHLIPHEAPERIIQVAALGRAWEFCLRFCGDLLSQKLELSDSRDHTHNLYCIKKIGNLEKGTLKENQTKKSKPSQKPIMDCAACSSVIRSFPWGMVSQCVKAGEESENASHGSRILLRAFIVAQKNVSDNVWLAALDVQGTNLTGLLHTIPFRLHFEVAKILLKVLQRLPSAVRYKVMIPSLLWNLYFFNIISAEERVEFFKRIYPTVFINANRKGEQTKMENNNVMIRYNELPNKAFVSYEKGDPESLNVSKSPYISLLTSAGHLPQIRAPAKALLSSDDTSIGSFGSRWLLAFIVMEKLTSRASHLPHSVLANIRFHHLLGVISFLSRVPFLTLMRGPLELCKTQSLLRPKNIETALRSLVFGGYFYNTFQLIKNYETLGFYPSVETFIFITSSALAPRMSQQVYCSRGESELDCQANTCRILDANNAPYKPLTLTQGSESNFIRTKIEVKNDQEWNQLQEHSKMYRDFGMLLLHRRQIQTKRGAHYNTGSETNPYPMVVPCTLNLDAIYCLQHRHAVFHPNVFVIHQQKDTAVIIKPSGLATFSHYALKEYGTSKQCPDLASAVLSIFPENKKIRAHGILHRLDSTTTGVMVIALSPRASLILTHQNLTRARRKTYLCLALQLDPGLLFPLEGKIRTPYSLTRDDGHMMSLEGDWEAETRYKVLEALTGCIYLIECSLRTGRQHQIRLHMRQLGLVLLGDNRYGAGISCTPLISRVALHASSVSCQMPDGAKIQIETTIPKDMNQVLLKLRAIGKP